MKAGAPEGTPPAEPEHPSSEIGGDARPPMTLMEAPRCIHPVTTLTNLPFTTITLRTDCPWGKRRTLGSPSAADLIFPHLRKREPSRAAQLAVDCTTSSYGILLERICRVRARRIQQVAASLAKRARSTTHADMRRRRDRASVAAANRPSYTANAAASRCERKISAGLQFCLDAPPHCAPPTHEHFMQAETTVLYCRR